ncbi:MAG: ImmA/IrrE family metallo-endopeptidase, partial [Hominimerdicola sp.]
YNVFIIVFVFTEIFSQSRIYLKFTSDLHQLSGMYTIVNTIPTVIINSNRDDKVQAMICAHELGHHFLHSDIAKEKCLQEFQIFKMCDRIEYEANIYASHLLIDNDELLSLLKEGRDCFTVAKILGVNPNLLNIKLTDLNTMGYKFDTSWGGTRLF